MFISLKFLHYASDIHNNLSKEELIDMMTNRSNQFWQAARLSLETWDRVKKGRNEYKQQMKIIR